VVDDLGAVEAVRVIDSARFFVPLRGSFISFRRSFFCTEDETCTAVTSHVSAKVVLTCVTLTGLR